MYDNYPLYTKVVVEYGQTGDRLVAGKRLLSFSSLRVFMRASLATRSVTLAM